MLGHTEASPAANLSPPDPLLDVELDNRFVRKKKKQYDEKNNAPWNTTRARENNVA